MHIIGFNLFIELVNEHVLGDDFLLEVDHSSNGFANYQVSRREVTEI